MWPSLWLKQPLSPTSASFMGSSFPDPTRPSSVWFPDWLYMNGFSFPQVHSAGGFLPHPALSSGQDLDSHLTWGPRALETFSE